MARTEKKREKTRQGRRSLLVCLHAESMQEYAYVIWKEGEEAAWICHIRITAQGNSLGVEDKLQVQP